MNRRSFLETLGFSVIGAILPDLSKIIELDYTLRLDADDVIPDPPVFTSALGICDYNGPIWIMDSMGEMYVSYDFWESNSPTWKETDDWPLGDYVTVTWDDLWQRS